MYELLFSPASERYFKKLKDKQLHLKFKDAILSIHGKALKADHEQIRKGNYNFKGIRGGK